MAVAAAGLLVDVVRVGSCGAVEMLVKSDSGDLFCGNDGKGLHLWKDVIAQPWTESARYVV